jgi:hypothetical protein
MVRLVESTQDLPDYILPREPYNKYYKGAKISVVFRNLFALDPSLESG